MSNQKAISVHFYVDGPNIDATLGIQILNRKPLRHQRPRWDRVRSAVSTQFGVDYSCFVLNGDKFGYSVAPLYRGLKHMGYDVEAPQRQEWCNGIDQDPVDECIKYKLGALKNLVEIGDAKGGLIASHDHGYAPVLREILAAGGFVGIVGFKEWLAPELVGLREEGATLIDLEYDLCAFDVSLDRPRFAA